MKNNEKYQHLIDRHNQACRDFRNSYSEIQREIREIPDSDAKYNIGDRVVPLGEKRGLRLGTIKHLTFLLDFVDDSESALATSIRCIYLIEYDNNLMYDDWVSEDQIEIYKQ